MNKSSCKFEIIHDIVTKSDNVLSVKELCEIAGVSRSGYYNWLKAAPLRELREEQDQKAFEAILAAYKFRGYAKGARGIHMRLLHLDPIIVMNVKKIRRLMKKYNLHCPIRKANPYRRMAKTMKSHNVADNILDRKFKEHGARSVMLTDITYIPFQEGFLYLSTIMDAVTKQLLAYRLSDSLEVDFVLETVTDLMENYGLSLNTETLIHSDQGVHYTSTSFIKLVEDSKLRRSMSRRGNCWDNAPQESFFGHMKQEVDFKGCSEFHEVQTIIDEWMDYYNNDRYQWELCKLSPNEYYEYLVTGVYPLPYQYKT